MNVYRKSKYIWDQYYLSSRHPFKGLEAYTSLIRGGHCSNRTLIIIILTILNYMFNALEFAGCFHRCHFYHEDISETFLQFVLHMMYVNVYKL